MRLNIAKAGGVTATLKSPPNMHLGNIAFDDAMQPAEQPVFVATLIIGADSVELLYDSATNPQLLRS